MGLRHARMNASAGLRHAHATLSLLSRLFPCYKKPAKINSSRSFHRAQWAALRLQGRRPSMLPSGGKCCNSACYGSIISVFTSISVFTFISVSVWSICLGGGGEASLFRHACMHANSDKHAWKVCYGSVTCMHV